MTERERLLQLVEQLTERHATWRRFEREDRATGVESFAYQAQIRAETYAEVVHNLCAVLRVEPPADVLFPYPPRMQ